jgi:hypothetical protein
MTFLAAGWLALLVPWAALVAWAWRRVADERATTAAFLWTSETTDVPRARSRRGRPPAWVIAALLAVLASILALAGPARRERGVRVSVVIDGSVSLAARLAGRTLRDELITRCGHELARSGDDITVDMRLVGLPDRRARVFNDARGAPFTARPTEAAIADAIAVGLRESDAVIVLTDRPIATRDGRVAVRAPTAKPDNVGIESAIAVERPRPSLMVRVANDSDRREATLEVRTGNSPVRQTIALPMRGEWKNYFVDLAAPGDQIEIALVDMDDSLAIDNFATLLRTKVPPRLTVDVGAPEVATRFASAYERARRSGSSGRAAIRLGGERSGVSDSGNSIVFGTPTREIRAGGVVKFDHPINRDVDLDSPRLVATPPPADWLPIALVDSAENAPMLAVRDSSARSVWIGFEPDPNDARSVVLLANAVDWIAESSLAEWQGEAPASIGNDWRPVALRDPSLDGSPGVYADGSDRQVAANVPAIVGPHGEARGDIGELLRRADRATLLPLQKPLAIAASCLACIAAMLSGRATLRLSGRRRVP